MQHIINHIYHTSHISYSISYIGSCTHHNTLATQLFHIKITVYIKVISHLFKKINFTTGCTTVLYYWKYQYSIVYIPIYIKVYICCIPLSSSLSESISHCTSQCIPWSISQSCTTVHVSQSLSQSIYITL